MSTAAEHRQSSLIEIVLTPVYWALLETYRFALVPKHIRLPVRRKESLSMICPLHPHHRLREVSSLLGLLFLLATVAAHRAVAEPNNAARRRAALLSAQASGSLTRERAANALTDSDPLVRRAAVACLAQHGKDAIPQLLQAIANTDPLVRRNAALSLGACGPDALDALKRAGRDAEPLVRHGAVLALMALEPRSIGAFNLLRRATEDGDNTVQQAASLAVAQYTEVLEGIRLPREGWKFKLDPGGVGEKSGWFGVDIDDSGWGDIQIEKAWGECGHKGYIGNGWYRRTVTLPKNPGGRHAILLFGGVDESAWVWVNGQFAGSHDIGPTGWDKPFRLDVSKLLKWQDKNQITIRAMNTAHAGGVWRPVTIVVSAPLEDEQ